MTKIEKTAKALYEAIGEIATGELSELSGRERDSLGAVILAIRELTGSAYIQMVTSAQITPRNTK